MSAAVKIEVAGDPMAAALALAGNAGLGWADGMPGWNGRRYLRETAP